MATSPTQRTLREMRNLGRRAEITEKWIARQVGNAPGFRKDLFGIVDVLALDPEVGFIGVQSCGQDFASHYRKITEEKAEEAIDWLKTPGGNLELWAWRKVKVKRGGKAMVWRPRVHVFTLEDLEVWRPREHVFTVEELEG